MTLGRLPRFALLSILGLAVGLVAVGCGGDSDDDGSDAEPQGTGTTEDGGPTRIEDLPPEARLFAYAALTRPFDGDAAQYLAVLAFDPVLPTMVPGDRELVSATIVPSPRGRGKNDEGATLVLVYQGATEDDTIQLTEQMQPMPDLSALDLETVDVGDGGEALVMPFADTDAIQIQWHACEITFAISSSVIDAETAGELGASMPMDCGADAAPTETPAEDGE
ncbi:MAG: hypothetical protein AB7F65_05435 [Dehalococcoidia bacterium]